VFTNSSKKNHPRNTGGPKVGNLPLDLLVRARVSLKVVHVQLQPKRLSHGLARVLHGGVLAGECSLEYSLGELLLLLWFRG